MPEAGNKPSVLDQLAESYLGQRRSSDLLRVRHALRILDATHVELDGKRLVNFASNDYLGLTHHPKMIHAVQRSAQQFGTGSGASALISGYSLEHRAAEAAIAQWKGAEAAVLLPSGYQAAHAVVQTLRAISREGGIRFLIDKLSHASLIDAVAGSSCAFRVFPHNGLSKLQRLLAEASKDQLQVVMTESIFSMDGDAADLGGLARLKQDHDFVLVLDEAHASGVYGPAGAGYAAGCGVQSIVAISIVTLSKALGLCGGAVCGSRAFCDALANCGRAYIYSTSVAPMTAGGVLTALQIFRDEPDRQTRLRQLAQRLRTSLSNRGLKIASGDSPIIPLILGPERRAIAAAQQLQDRGFFVVAIRPPTVSRNSSRLRLTVCCEHTDEELDQLIDAICAATG